MFSLVWCAHHSHTSLVGVARGLSDGDGWGGARVSLCVCSVFFCHSFLVGVASGLMETAGEGVVFLCVCVVCSSATVF